MVSTIQNMIKSVKFMAESTGDQISQYEKHTETIQNLLDESKVEFTKFMSERVTELKSHEEFLQDYIKKQELAGKVEIERLNNIKFHSFHKFKSSF